VILFKLGGVSLHETEIGVGIAGLVGFVESFESAERSWLGFFG
jgi:hypothetical protein